MFAKRLFHNKHNVQQGLMPSLDLDPQISLHYGIPSTASVLAFDPIQRLLAIGTLDGRIKVIGGHNIEGLFISPKQLPFKSLEFLHNQGYILSVSNENDIQVWDLEQRCAVCCMQWESNITAFSVIQGTHFMYVGDENGMTSVLKYDNGERKLYKLPYHIPASLVAESAKITLPTYLSVVGLLPQPCTSANRVVIAYENGLIVLWDMSEARAVLVRGYAGLQMTDDVTMSETSGELHSEKSNYEQEKEICSLCWASSSGSVLVVGYIDGDILLWSMSFTTKGPPHVEESSNKVVKLQLSSGERRLPVIVLNWSTNVNYNDSGGHLFIYGGDEVGSEEVITVLTIKWSSGIETLRCISRVDLALNGSFADMICIPGTGPFERNSFAALFVLTSPGQIHAYDGSSFSNLPNDEQAVKPSVFAEQFPVVVPTLDPYLTVSKLSSLEPDSDISKLLLEIADATKISSNLTLFGGTKWPLTGGVPVKISSPMIVGIKKFYVAGYQDGSVRIWDASGPVLSLTFVLKGEVSAIKVAGLSAPVSALDIFTEAFSLAVGNECGQVRIYKLCGSSGESSFHFVSENQHEVHAMHHQRGLSCVSVLCIQNSPVRALQFSYSGAKLAVGFECGQVAVIDMDSFSVLSLMHCISGSTSPVISIISKRYRNMEENLDHVKSQESEADSMDGTFLVLTKDAHIGLVDGARGHMISSRPLHPRKESTAISLHVIGWTNERNQQVTSEENVNQAGSCQAADAGESKLQELELQSASDILPDSLLLLGCADAIRLYYLKSVLEGNDKAAHKVKLAKPCCWSTIFKTKERTCGLALLYQTGDIELRSLPDLEVVGESSLKSILRWNFKASMEKAMSSTDNAQIALVNGCEIAFVSILGTEPDFGIPESQPCLHDKDLAAAADAAIGFSLGQKKKQNTGPGILGGIIKGLKGGKVIQCTKTFEVHGKSGVVQQLESTFLNVPFSEPVVANESDDGFLDIDDIDIDDDTTVASTSSYSREHERDEKAERQQLFHGATEDVKPRLRTAQEIRAQYRKTGDASSVAADARDKLAQRGEKLERISRRTAELESGAENFASMADELVKTMEGRKWWQI